MAPGPDVAGARPGVGHARCVVRSAARRARSSRDRRPLAAPRQVAHDVVGLERMVGVAVLRRGPEAEVGRRPARARTAGAATSDQGRGGGPGGWPSARATGRRATATATRPSSVARIDPPPRSLRPWPSAARPRWRPSALGSLGRPSTISPRMLRWICDRAGVDRAGPGVEERHGPRARWSSARRRRRSGTRTTARRPVGTMRVGTEDVDRQLGGHAVVLAPVELGDGARPGPGGDRRGTGSACAGRGSA